VRVCVCMCTEQLTAETPFSSFPTRGKIKWTLMSLLGPRSYNPTGECCGLHSYSLFFSGRLCQLNKKQIHSACAKIKKGKKGISAVSCSVHMHTHTRTRIHIYAYTHRHPRVCTRMHAYACTHTCEYIHMHVNTHPPYTHRDNTHIHIYTYHTLIQQAIRTPGA